MARIWNWGGQAFSDLSTHIEWVRTTTFEPGLNLFAQAVLNRVVVDTSRGTPSLAQATISRYAVWNADGTQTEKSLDGFQSAAFIQNCAWVEMAVGVQKGQASANLMLIEWS